MNAVHFATRSTVLIGEPINSLERSLRNVLGNNASIGSSADGEKSQTIRFWNDNYSPEVNGIDERL